MKEEICKEKLDEKEREKWVNIIQDEIDTNPEFKQFEEVEEKENSKSRTYAKIYNDWYVRGGDCIAVNVYRDMEHRYRDEIKNPGWFSGYRTEHHWESSDMNPWLQGYLFNFCFGDMSIVVHNEKIYKFCKQFAKKHKLKKLIKCWNGVI